MCEFENYCNKRFFRATKLQQLIIIIIFSLNELSVCGVNIHNNFSYLVSLNEATHLERATK